MDEIPKQRLSGRETIDSASVCYAEFTKNIQNILYGEVDALEFLLQGDLVSDF